MIAIKAVTTTGETSALCQSVGLSRAAFYRRLAARTGKAKAVTATARKLAILFYKALRCGMTYADPGVSSYEERYRQRVIHNLQRRAKSLGFTLITASPTTEGVS